MNADGARSERRRCPALRALVDGAAPLQKATLRWGARQLRPDTLAELESMISRHEVNSSDSEAFRRQERMRRAFNSATDEQKAAIRWVVSKLGPDKVAELEALVGRNERILGKTPDTK